MLPTLVDVPPAGTEWLHEIKYDGYRTELTIRGKDVHAYTSNGHDWAENHGPVMTSARALRCRSAILDGEMSVQNGSASPKRTSRSTSPKLADLLQPLDRHFIVEPKLLRLGVVLLQCRCEVRIDPKTP